MNQLSLRNNWLKFLETWGQLRIVLEESIEYTSNEWKHNQEMSTCNHRLDLEPLGSRLTDYAQKLLGTRLDNVGKSCLRDYYSKIKWIQPYTQKKEWRNILAGIQCHKGISTVGLGGDANGEKSRDWPAAGDAVHRRPGNGNALAGPGINTPRHRYLAVQISSRQT